MLHYDDICKINEISQLQNIFLMEVHLGVRQFILTPEDGQKMNDTCSINYYI